MTYPELETAMTQDTNEEIGSQATAVQKKLLKRYREIRAKSLIIVSDAISAGGSVIPGVREVGIGELLSSKAGYTNILDLTYSVGPLVSLETSLRRVLDESLERWETTIHIFVSLQTADGSPIPPNEITLNVWKRITRMCNGFRKRPYMIIDSHVIGHDDRVDDQQTYRSFIDTLIGEAEKHCLIESGSQYWATLFRQADNGDERGTSFLNLFRPRANA
jgi:hypothetical protein